MGPSYVPGCTSGEFVGDLLNGKYPSMPRFMIPVVDVRDVAHAHLLGLKVPEAAGNRFFLCEKTMWFREVAHAIN